MSQSIAGCPPVAVSQQRSRGPVVGLEHPQRLPALGASHAEIHGIVRIGREIDRLALLQMDLQAAAGGAEAADHRGHGIGRLPGGNLSQAEPARDAIELLRQGTGPLVEKRKQFVVWGHNRISSHSEVGWVPSGASPTIDRRQLLE